MDHNLLVDVNKGKALESSATTGVSTSATAEIVRVDQALESMRDSGFDLAAAVGEVVDNSIEGSASVIRVETFEEKVQIDGKKKGGRAVTSVAFADNGVGISAQTLPHTLTLGYSTRYNQRNGMGRFGVGMKLAGISQGRRIDIYTKHAGSDHIYRAFLDLDLISQHIQQDIQVEEVDDFPAQYEHLMQNRSKDEEEPRLFESGTLVVWSKIDRISDGGSYASSVEEKMQSVTKFLARAYRRFIDSGVRIELNGRHITLHDPLFLLDNPRVVEQFKQDLRGKVIEQDHFEIGGHQVDVTVSLYPVEFRDKKGVGGREDRAGDQFKNLYIPENKGRVSILRNGREIYYAVIPGIFPEGTGPLDRFIGVEVSFPAQLDEYFQVRHVKRGAEPVDKLRNDIRSTIKRPIEVARKQIRADWDRYDSTESDGSNGRESTYGAVQNAEQTSPHGQAGMTLTPEEVDSKLDEVLEDLNIDPVSEPEKAAKVKKEIQDRAITIIDASWSGKELFEILHLNKSVVIKVNHRHGFIRDIYDPLKEFAKHDSTAVDVDSALALIKKVGQGLDILFMAYAKAETMNRDPEMAYGDLRSFWGTFAQAYVRQLTGT